MLFFENCMESVFAAMNVRRSGPDDDKQTYVDMTMMVEVPAPEIVAYIDVSLVALLFDNARMAVKSATPSRQVHFPRQDLSFATQLFEGRWDNDVALNIDSGSVKVKTLYPADEDGNGAKVKLLFSFVVPEKRHLALLAELIGEPIWFIGRDSLTQDEPKKKTDPDYVEPLEGQEKLFKDEPKRTDSKLHAVK
jgi:hypothetical protein